MTLGAMDHLGITLGDLAKSEATFYAPILGFLGYERVEATEAMTVWYSRTARSAINLWQAQPALARRKHERYAPGFHHFAFSATSREEVDTLHRLLLGIGAAVLDAPAEYDYLPGYYAVFFADPDGLKFELVHIPPFDVDAGETPP
ncbi:MAG: bleomycin resistance protein [Alphaproteobacteria bacterium]|nr:bleomycin resistance protein [Alphaproteobacteria bacterium]